MKTPKPIVTKMDPSSAVRRVQITKANSPRLRMVKAKRLESNEFRDLWLQVVYRGLLTVSAGGVMLDWISARYCVGV